MKVVIEGKHFEEHAGSLAKAIAEPPATMPSVIEVAATSVKDADEFINLLNSRLDNQNKIQQL